MRHGVLPTFVDCAVLQFCAMLTGRSTAKSSCNTAGFTYDSVAVSRDCPASRNAWPLAGLGLLRERLPRAHALNLSGTRRGGNAPSPPNQAHVTPMPAPQDFLAIDIRVGTVRRAEPFPEARKPSIRLEIDFGPLGVLRSSAQLTRRYAPEALVGRQVVAVVNIGERRIAGFTSQALVLGGVPEEGDVVLLAPDAPVPDGTRIA